MLKIETFFSISHNAVLESEHQRVNADSEATTEELRALQGMHAEQLSSADCRFELAPMGMIIQNHLTEEHNSNYCSSILYNSFYQIVCHEEG